LGVSPASASVDAHSLLLKNEYSIVEKIFWVTGKIKSYTIPY
jgi:hypothetical protein